MRPARKVLTTALISCALAADALIVAIWLTRPSQFYWLELGPSSEAPVRKLIRWTYGHLSPFTPYGFLSIFEPLDLFVVVVLLFVFFVLAVLLLMMWGTGCRSLSARLGSPISGNSAIRFRLTAAMLAVAVVGLELGWEVNGWETWRMRERHFHKLVNAAQHEANARSSVQQLSESIRRIESSTAEANESLTEEAAVTARAAWLDRLKRDLRFAALCADAYQRHVKKCEYGVAHPRTPVAPDPPLPAQEIDWRTWEAMRKYAQALDALSKEIHRYPALWDTHRGRAWLLATCPDARFRDGKAAVESAVRAAELTKWNNPVVLDTLAAAFAEAADFKAAVHWSGKALERMTATGMRWRAASDRLALYEAGKPYRQK